MNIIPRKQTTFNKADFPSLKLAIPFCENSLTDVVSGLTYKPTTGSYSYATGSMAFTSANTASTFGIYDTSINNAPGTCDFMLVGFLDGFDNLSGSVTLGTGGVTTADDGMRLQVTSSAGVVFADAPATASLTHAAGAGAVHAIVGRWVGADLQVEYYVSGQAVVTSTLVGASVPVFGNSAQTSLLQIVGSTLPCSVGYLAYWSFTKRIGSSTQTYGRASVPSQAAIKDGVEYLAAVRAISSTTFLLPPMWKGL